MSNDNDHVSVRRTRTRLIITGLWPLSVIVAFWLGSRGTRCCELNFPNPFRPEVPQPATAAAEPTVDVLLPRVRQQRATLESRLQLAETEMKADSITATLLVQRGIGDGTESTSERLLKRNEHWSHAIEDLRRQLNEARRMEARLVEIADREATASLTATDPELAVAVREFLLHQSPDGSPLIPDGIWQRKR